jgi:CRP-like cAMP-binding protein
VSELKKLYDESEKLRTIQMSCLPNTTLFSEGDRSFEMYILLSGRVEILKNSKRIAIVEEEGSYLGELSTLLEIPRTATVRTLSHCKFVVVNADKVMDFFASSPPLGFKLARILADRLAKMNIGYVKLEEKADRLANRLKEAEDKVSKRDRQIEQFVARLEKMQGLR